MESKERYFIVMFKGAKGDKELQGIVSVRENKFIGREKINQMLMKENGLTDVILTNIIELSSDDYKDWNAKLDQEG